MNLIQFKALKNNVRTIIFEFLQDNHPQQIASFLQFIDSWNPEENHHYHAVSQPIPRICQVLFNRFVAEHQSLPISEQWLEAVLSQENEFTPELTFEINELSPAMLGEKTGILPQDEQPTTFTCPDIIGTDPVWMRLINQAIAAARSDFSVLIIGETGVGKELIARCIHAHSRRAQQNCVVVNCGGIPEALTNSEFHGYAGGAFTGANRKGKKGWLEKANGGTLVLDEVSELPLSSQPGLLRALQSGEAQKIGGETFQVDFRLISITNKPLEPEVNAGSFRRDLFYRLSVIPLFVPPLRERQGDIVKLALHFLNMFKINNPQLNQKIFSPDSLSVMKRYPWYGNARELQNVVARALVLCPDDIIQPEHLVFNQAIAGQDHENNETTTNSLLDVCGEKIGKVPSAELEKFLKTKRLGFSSGDYARKFCCSEATARRHLQMLQGFGIVTCSGRGRGTKYCLSQVISADS